MLWFLFWQVCAWPVPTHPHLLAIWGKSRYNTVETRHGGKGAACGEGRLF